jgi:DNA invertase Pin-like site-specific DNA recombinase
MEGIARAKAEGRYQGRPKSIDPAEINAMFDNGLGATEIAKKLGVGRASVYRLRDASNPARRGGSVADGAAPV